MASHVPAQGEFVALTFDPQAGHEQMDRRPVLVVSVDAFNRGTGFAFCCPLTNTNRNTPFHVPVPDGLGLSGFVMCEQMKSVDYRARNAKSIATAPTFFLEEVLSVIDACIYPSAD